MQLDVCTDFIRHIKVVGTYGEPIVSECGMGQGCCLSLIAANATVAIEFRMLQHKTPEVHKSAFIDDRTLDIEEVQQLEVAIGEVAKMDNLMGHTTNVGKSKVFATTRRTKKQAGQMAIGDLKLDLANDFKLLGHRCVAAHRFIIQDADEVATEARISVRRTATLPLDHTNKLKILIISLLKVFTAATQWGRAKMADISKLISEILRVVRGRTRKLRAMEVVLGLLYEATDYHPGSAMVWNSIATARRMIMKDSNRLQQTKQLYELREDRFRGEHNAQGTKAEHKAKVVPKRRLSHKTSEEEVPRMNQTQTIAKTMDQRGIAQAEFDRNIENAENEGGSAGSGAKGWKDQQDIAQAESDRSNQPQARGGTTTEKNEDLFEPSYHPEAASSDGRERTWHKVGESVILIIADAQGKTDAKKDGNDTEEQMKPQNDEQGPKLDNKLKLKCIPGPIGSLIDQAGVFGLQLAINAQGDLEFSREGSGPIPLTKWGERLGQKRSKGTSTTICSKSSTKRSNRPTTTKATRYRQEEKIWRGSRQMWTDMPRWPCLKTPLRNPAKTMTTEGERLGGVRFRTRQKSQTQGNVA